MNSYKDNLLYIEKAKDGDIEAQENLIRMNYPLAVSLARRFMGRGCELEDLIQLALFGMLKAIRSFDPERGCTFSTYAVPLIIGEIRKFLRDDGLIKVSRENKKNSAVLLRLREEFSREYGREPHIDELCSLSGMSRETVIIALDCSKPVASISEPLTDEGGFTVENILGDDGASIESTFDRIALTDALSKLPEEWKKIIIMRYFRDMSQQQTANALGLSQVKVSREEKKIIQELRKSIV
ncbi:MAG: sigma-70 family RNA polymerase sigma factor [Clostridia bacterium]|nr:sigma-70 family RNA polymerase sigma factor [Clostridia bacterium]